jgi:WD40 repeat protein/serine/threonine protein kinase
MDPNSERIIELFSQAMSKPAEARAAFLAETCRDKPEVRQQIESLLRAAEPAREFLKQPLPQLIPAPDLPAEKPGDQIGRYKLREKVGEGGCGVVYVADQEEPMRRRVALKVIKLGMDTRQVIARFEAERQALALMDHPNIAKVLDAGATETGRPYFVMELVRGIKITDYCDQSQCTTRQRLDLFMQVCKAIQHAHQKGIIHRDIKPSNILVTLHDGVPVPKVIDFGIAKATEGRLTEQTVYTALHEFIGTPAYISPEQAEMSGLDIDTRSDIYSLGVLLYELLTGKTPFDASELVRAGLDGLRRTIREQAPLRPSTKLGALQSQELTTTARLRGVGAPELVYAIRGDLDWIAMKCLEKDRARRYETANGLARDIERHLHNEPVTARPPSKLYELRKTVRRNWVGFTAVATVVASLAIGVVIQREEIHQRSAAETAQTKEAAQRHRAEADEQLAQRLAYAAKMRLAQGAWEQNRVGHVRRVLEETADYPDRGFEWYYWQRQIHLELKTLRGHLRGVGCVAFSPDGKRVAAGSDDRTVIVWDAATGDELLTLRGHLNEVDTVAFSSDGQRVLTAGRDHTARIWDAQSGKQLLTLEGHTGRIQVAAFSPDGQRVLTSSWDGTARIWDAATGNTLVKLEGHLGALHGAAFSPDGRRVVTGGDDKVGRVWDPLTGKELLSLAGHSGAIESVAWSPDGRRIVTGSDQTDPTARVWDAATGEYLFTLAGHSGQLSAVTFSSDNGRIVTCSDDRTARVWDALTGKVLFSLKGHTGGVNDVAISRDGTRIVTGSDDRTAKVWDASRDRQVLTLKGHTGNVISAAFSRDGRRIVTGGAEGDLTARVWDARVWDAATGDLVVMLQGQHSRPIRSVAFSPDGRRIVTGSGDHTAKVWDVASGQYLFTLPGHHGPLTQVAFSPDGQRIATGSTDTTARVWDSASGKLLLTFARHTEGINDLAFSPDGRRIATASSDQTAKVWDVATGREWFELKDADGKVAAVAFSPDGRQLATACADGSAKLWDVASGKRLLIFRGHSDEVRWVAFSPDGRRVVTGGLDRTAKVWDTASGEELLTLEGTSDDTSSVAFSPDGYRILTSGDVTAKLWDAVTPGEFAQWQTEEKSALERLSARERELAAREQQARASSALDPGAIKQWLAVGPLRFVGHDGAKGLAEQQIPDEAQIRPRADQPIKGTDFGWRAIQLHDYVVDFFKLYTADPPWTVTYLACYIQSDSDQTNLVMKVGSQNQAKIYLNGRELYHCEQPRQYVPDQDVVTNGVELTRGTNVLVFKVVNEEDASHASLRFADAAGQPLKGIRVTITPP